ncbi:hypothetical protein [Burkholderia cepacia]|uniref:hypothetical protein n=1 Tax=Burkholderia cepacia TaxID=292 RepID=UPI0012D4AAD9|nr:hypothetical protein [Burkholderia cepacia]
MRVVNWRGAGRDDAPADDCIRLRNSGRSGNGGGSAADVRERTSASEPESESESLESGEEERLEAFETLGEDREMFGMASPVASSVFRKRKNADDRLRAACRPARMRTHVRRSDGYPVDGRMPDHGGEFAQRAVDSHAPPVCDRIVRA